MGRSVMNVNEVAMAAGLVHFLLCNDTVRPDQVTVLTPYKGQLHTQGKPSLPPPPTFFLQVKGTMLIKDFQ